MEATPTDDDRHWWICPKCGERTMQDGIEEDQYQESPCDACAEEAEEETSR